MQKTQTKTPVQERRRRNNTDVLSNDDNEFDNQSLTSKQPLVDINRMQNYRARGGAAKTEQTDSADSDDFAEQAKAAAQQVHKKKSWAGRAFAALDCESRGYLLKHEILNHFIDNGVESHGALKAVTAILKAKSHKCPITYDEFEQLVAQNNFMKKVIENQLVIPEFHKFWTNFQKCFNEIREDPDNLYSSGEVASYIPPLAKASPSTFAAAWCSSDGQFSQLGDYKIKFSIQSVGKVFAYAMLHNIYESNGKIHELHKWVGEEPSGVAFNSPVFDKKGRPHNPMVNAGAIMVSTLLVNEGKTIEDFQEFYMKGSCADRADIDLPLYKDEALTGCNNHALRSLMLAKNCYPKKPTFEETNKLAADGLDFYFIQCSMLVDVEGIARFGAMLANNGINPSTGERVVSPQTVKSTVTLMQVCGMYDGAGKFTKDHGVPSKSGVAGGLLTVIPGLGAVGSCSPPLNEEGNTVRGIGMIEKLSDMYSNINLFYKDQNKWDMTKRPHQTNLQTIIAGTNAAADGDLEAVIRLNVLGVDLNHGDYDDRTALHLASATGHLDVVKYLVEQGVNVNPYDRWGSTPLNDAQDQEIIDFLEANGGVRGNDYTVLDVPDCTVTDDQFRLLYAAQENNLLLVQSLNICGWRVNAYDYDGRSALSIAASEGHLDIVTYLLAHGADVNHRDVRNNDALADARREGRQEVVAFLEEFIQRSRKQQTRF